MKVPSPREIGLPEKFEAWRPNQEAAFELLMQNKGVKRTKGLCMPTGSGKSLVYTGYAIWSKEPTCFVTQSKGLQSQLTDEFGSMGMVDLRGHSNYQCLLRDEYSCEEGAAARCPHKGSVSCPSSQAEMRAASSMLVTTNYAKWTSARKYGQGMSHFSQVVFDEGHYAPEAIAQAMQVVLHHKEIEETVKVNFLGYPENQDMANWKDWAKDVTVTVEKEMQTAYRRIKDAKGDPKPTWVKHYTHMKYLLKRLGVVATANPSNWVVDELDDGFVFDPIRPGRYGEAMLLLKIPSVLFVSANLRPKTMYMSGMSKQDFVFEEFDSDFDPADCPIYYIPTQFVDSRHPDMSMAYIRMDQWIAPRKDRKGIVHTISHTRREEIMAKSRFEGQMIFNERGEPTMEKVDQYVTGQPGTILVSPSVGTGYDFPGKLCEWAWLCKIPFQPPSKILIAREEDDPEYRIYKPGQAMEQIFGRGNRYKGDRCESGIPDDNMKWFIGKYKHLASRSFLKRLKTVDFIPRPLPKL